MRQRVAVNWSVSSFFGWGVYALNLALQWSQDPDVELMTTVPVDLRELAVDPIRFHALRPFLALSKALQNASPPLGTARHQLECPVLSDIDLRPGCLDHWITGQPTIGVVFFDTAHLAADIIARARSLRLIVAGSEWNRRILHEHGIDHVVTVLQGVDPALYHPAPAGGFLGDRFCVFSGGKLEHRKAQDIVLAAFRGFAQRHAEALLVTAWHSPWRELARSLDLSGLVSPVQFGPGGSVDVTGWAAANGIDPAQILDLGAVPNHEMPAILREMDVAVFPNRCEGGTNLVAMECMACGLPVVLSRNTGHLDLIDGDNCFALERQMPLDGYGAGLGDVAGWGESSVEEVVEMLELVFADRTGARHRGRLAADGMTRLTWKHTAERLKGLIFGSGLPSR
jgi:glycosyltransferase involved in cell wall biosynthesis